MRISTLPRYLVGSRDAIAEIAGSPMALVVGAVFVLSAAFARTWDTVDLLAQPTALLRPFAASLASSAVVFLVVYTVLAVRCRIRHEDRPPFAASGRAFLALYWWTAPLAWIYAIPVERWADISTSVGANMWMLFLVSVWRVALMVRVLSVLLGTNVAPTAAILLFLADVIALVAIAIAPVPVFLVMGGIDVTNPDAVLSANLFGLQILLVLALLPLVVAAIGGVVCLRRAGPLLELRAGRVPATVWTIAVGAVAAFLLLSTWTQPALRRATALNERSLAADAEGFAALARTLTPDDLPPHWTPRVERPGRRRERTDEVFQRLAALQDAIARPDVPAFVRARAERTIDSRLGEQVGTWNRWSDASSIAHHLAWTSRDAPLVFVVLERHGREASHLETDERAAIAAAVQRARAEVAEVQDRGGVETAPTSGPER
ncbi:MAG: hypothetical protein JNM94_13535 [Phycisphaerae bacterium]|nr:hypothetical protein [Phycisphaerae bacterium]